MASPAGPFHGALARPPGVHFSAKSMFSMVVGGRPRGAAAGP